MRAVVCERLGDPCAPLGGGVLRLDQAYPKPPELPPGHLRIRVAAASLNFPDALMVKGQYQEKPPLPFIPGSEVAGRVLEVGQGVKGFTIGDKVVAVVTRGGFAEEVVVPAAATWRVPGGVDLSSAAAIPIAYGTTHLALVHRAGLKAGQTLLVLGASGGVGTAAVQIGKLLGARVIAVTRGAAKSAYLEQLLGGPGGKHVVIDTAAAAAGGGAGAGAGAGAAAGGAGKGAPLHKLIRAVAPKGVDVVYDPVGGPFFSEALKTISWGGHYLVIGFAAGAIPQVSLNLLLVKNVTLHGVFWGSYMQRGYQVLVGGVREVMGWWEEGKISVQVSHRFPLSRVPEAMSCLLGRQVQGKILITMEGEGQEDAAAAGGGSRQQLSSKL